MHNTPLANLALSPRTLTPCGAATSPKLPRCWRCWMRN